MSRLRALSRRTRVLSGGISVLAAVGLGLGLSSQAGATSARATAHPKWTTLFSYTFNGKRGALPSASVWRYFHGLSSGIAAFVPSTSYVELNGAGDLVITAKHTATGWYSAQIGTRASFMPKAGHSLRVEARIKFPDGGQGYWPAFWGVAESAFSNPKSEPEAGEVDIAETINDDRWASQIIHCGPSKNSGPCVKHSQKTGHFHYFSKPSGKAGWHVYSYIWKNTRQKPSLTFYVDNRPQLVISESTIGGKWWRAAFDHPYSFLFDMAVGGWAGLPNSHTAKSASMWVNYIHIASS